MINMYILPATANPINSDLINDQYYKGQIDQWLVYQSGDHRNYILSSLKMMSEINKGGSLEFTAPYNSAFSKLYPPKFDMEGNLENANLGGAIYIYNDAKLIWCGSIIDKEIDYYGNQYVKCQDETYGFQNLLVNKKFLKDFISEENEIKVVDFFDTLIHTALDLGPYTGELGPLYGPLGSFGPGEISEDLKNELITFELSSDGDDYEYLGDLLKVNLIDNLGGYIIPRRDAYGYYFDYKSGDYLLKNEDQILDVNSISNLKIKMSTSNSYNGILGKYVTENGYNIDSYRKEYSGYFLNWLFMKIENFQPTLTQSVSSQIDDYFERYIKGKYPEIEIEITAFDKSLLDSTIKPIKEGELIRVISEKHNIDNYFLCNKVEIDFLQPENNKYYIGGSANNITDINKKSSKKFDFSVNFTSKNVSRINQRLTNLGG